MAAALFGRVESGLAFRWEKNYSVVSPAGYGCRKKGAAKENQLTSIKNHVPKEAVLLARTTRQKG